MPAAKCNYLVIYKDSSQVYSSANLVTALKTPLPVKSKLEDRRILFITFTPDSEELCVVPLDEEQIQAGLDKVAKEEQAAQEKRERLAAAAAEERLRELQLRNDEEDQDETDGSSFGEL